jgi:hypothetical protein
MILDRFVGNEARELHEWSVYFNVAGHLFPQRFDFQARESLCWPSPTFDGPPRVSPSSKANFEYHYSDNYAEQGSFFGLSPLADYPAKIARAQPRSGSIDMFALLIATDLLTFIGPGRVLAGERNMQCIVLVNDSATPEAVIGQLKMWVNDSKGATVRSEVVTLQESYWIRLLPPAQPGNYELRFQAELESGALLQMSAPLRVVQSPD